MIMIGNMNKEATHLDRVKAKVGGHSTHNILSKHHALWTTEAPEGSVGGQVGLTRIACHSCVSTPVANDQQHL